MAADIGPLERWRRSDSPVIRSDVVHEPGVIWLGRLRRFGVGCQLAALVGSAGLRAFVSRPLVAVVAGGMVLLRTLLRSRGFRENSRCRGLIMAG